MCRWEGNPGMLRKGGSTSETSTGPGCRSLAGQWNIDRRHSIIKGYKHLTFVTKYTPLCHPSHLVNSLRAA
jgi:hypothetical protein